MAEKESRFEICRVVILCFFWYVVSSGNNVIGKTLLNEFPYPMTVTMAQLLSITVYSGPVFNWMGVRRRTEISRGYYKQFIIPLAVGKFFASVFSHVSIWKVPVSYAHTVKATMPMFTVVLARIIFGEKQTFKIYASLVPIIIGVGIATVSELSFDCIGLVAALAATCGFSLQYLFSKKVMNETGIHHLRLLHLLGQLSLYFFLPVWFFSDGLNILNDDVVLVRRAPNQTLLLLLMDGLLNWLQNIIAFTLLHHVTPLTYAVANATKRISVVTVSLMLLKNPVTLTNVGGMVLAIMGVLQYNKVKYDDRQLRKHEALIPLMQSNLNIQSEKPTSNGFFHWPYHHPAYSTVNMVTNISEAQPLINGHNNGQVNGQWPPQEKYIVGII